MSTVQADPITRLSIGELCRAIRSLTPEEQFEVFEQSGMKFCLLDAVEDLIVEVQDCNEPENE